MSSRMATKRSPDFLPKRPCRTKKMKTNNDRIKRNVTKWVKHRPWVDRLKNRTAFGQACSTLITDRGWLSDAKKGHLIQIDRGLQNEILQGFRKFYCKKRYKRQYIDTAGGMTWKLCANGKNGCFILTDSKRHSLDR